MPAGKLSDLVIPRIETERLVVTLLRPSLAELMVRFRLENQRHLTAWEPLRSPQFYTEPFWQAQLQANLIDFSRGESCSFVMLNRAENQVLGVINFTQGTRGTMQSCQLGYALGGAFEGQGYMQEGVSAALQYVFDVLKLHRVSANYIPHNGRSARLLTRLGFEVEGRARAFLKINGQWEDHILTALINPDSSL